MNSLHSRVGSFAIRALLVMLSVSDWGVPESTFLVATVYWAFSVLFGLTSI